jgi:hypothetical protein
MTKDELKECVKSVKEYTENEEYFLVPIESIKVINALAQAVLEVMDADEELIEKLSEKVHKSYCEYFKTRHDGSEYWTKGDYFLLTNEGKEYDRVTVRTILSEIKDKLMGGSNDLHDK